MGALKSLPPAPTGGPDVAVSPVLPPAGLIGVDHRAGTDAFQDLPHFRSSPPGNLVDGPDSGPNAQFQLMERYHWMVLTGSRPSSRRVTIRLTRLAPGVDAHGQTFQTWGSRRFRHQVRAEDMFGNFGEPPEVR